MVLSTAKPSWRQSRQDASQRSSGSEHLLRNAFGNSERLRSGVGRKRSVSDSCNKRWGISLARQIRSNRASRLTWLRHMDGLQLRAWPRIVAEVDSCLAGLGLLHRQISSIRRSNNRPS